MLKAAAISEAIKKAIGQEAYDTAKTELSARKLPSGLTEEEQVALYAWTLDTGKEALYVRVNKALRTGDGLDNLKPLIDAMESGLDKLPSFTGEVYRGVKESRLGKEGLAEFLTQHEIGKIVEYPGFTSATQIYEESLRGRLKLYIDSVHGKNISAFSDKPDQQETLFKTNSRFEVVENRIKENGVIQIWLIQLY